MSTQPETGTYDATVYQIANTDSVVGGAGAPINNALLNLANRTGYLKALVATEVARAMAAEANLVTLGGSGVSTQTIQISDTPIDVHSAVNSNAVKSLGVVPPGTLITFAGQTAPSGYLPCPTSAGATSQLVLRATYANLFTALGTYWGVGDGATTFGIPWFPAGYALIQSSGVIGPSGISSGQMPSHSHSVPQGADITTGSTCLGGSGRGWDGTQTTGSAGTGTANLAAGVPILICVKF